MLVKLVFGGEVALGAWRGSVDMSYEQISSQKLAHTHTTVFPVDLLKAVSPYDSPKCDSCIGTILWAAPPNSTSRCRQPHPHHHQ